MTFFLDQSFPIELKVKTKYDFNKNNAFKKTDGFFVSFCLSH